MIIFKALLFYFALLLTAFCINYKFNTAVRVIAFKEQEDKGEAKAFLVGMMLASLLWTLYLYI